MQSVCVAFREDGEGRLGVSRLRWKVEKGAVVWRHEHWLIKADPAHSQQQAETFVNAAIITLASMERLPILKVHSGQVVYKAGSFEAVIAQRLLDAERDGLKT